MPFNSDKQRKAFFAKQGTTRSATNPTISMSIANIKQKIEAHKGKGRLKREQKGKERIEREEKALKHEQEQAKRLAKEAIVLEQRELTARHRMEAQQRIREAEKVRRGRTFIGKVGKKFAEKKAEKERFLKTPEGKAHTKKVKAKTKEFHKRVSKEFKEILG